MNDAEKAYQYFVIAVPENEEQAKAYFWARKALQSTLTPPNEWVSVEERLPENDGWYLVYAPGYWGNSKIYGLDGLAYSNFKHNYKVHWGIERGTGRGWPGIVTHWMELPVPPGKDNNAPTKAPNEPLSIEQLRQGSTPNESYINYCMHCGEVCHEMYGGCKK